MKKKSEFIFLFCLISLIAYSLSLTAVFGDVYTAAGCSRSDVQAAIDAASNGDTVIVPEGTATWTTAITISKGITVQGADIGRTVITITDGSAVSITNNTGSFLRITGFTFDGTGYEYAGYPNGGVAIGDAKNFRVDHIRLHNVFHGFVAVGIAEGLVDNCTYYLHETKHYYTPFPFSYPNVYYDDANCSHWNYYHTRPLEPGTSNAWYIEDCHIDMDEDMFRSSGILAGNNGARIVFRYNTGFGPVDICELYGISPWRHCRSLSWVEMYKNRIHFKNIGYVFQFRGGTGVIFDNEITGNVATPGSQFFHLRNDRSCREVEHYYCEGSIVVRSDQCDGTASSDGNYPGMGGYPCLGQIGRGPGPFGGESSAPMYEWNNTYNGIPFHANVSNQCAAETAHIQEGRDYYNDTQMLGYTPYTYPHPLQGGEPPPPDTTPPSNIATVNDGTTGSDIDSTLSTTQLQANWTPSTDGESGISGYKYAIGTTPGGTDEVNWTTLGNVTSVTRGGLTLLVGTTYYFSVKAENRVSLQSPSATNSDGQCVLAGGTGGDETPPAIFNVNAVNITMAGATIIWDTDEPATSQVKYGASAASYGNSTSEDSNLVTSHSVNLTGLIPGIEYHYRVISKDSSSNEKISTDYTFKTPGEEIDAKVYPSPYSPSKGSSMRFSVSGTTGGEVKIYTISGKLVKKLVIQSGVSEVSWNVLNEDGNSITTGLYIYCITDGDGNKKTGKIAITN